MGAVKEAKPREGASFMPGSDGGRKKERPFLELKGISFSYPGKDANVLKGIDLSFPRGGISAIVGPNGSGKTTLTKVMLGLISPGSGEISLEGQPLQTYTLAQIGRRLGYVFQNPNHQLFCSTVAEEIGFGLTNIGEAAEVIEERVDFLLDYFELSPYRDKFPLHLSYGEKQRLAIAAVLAAEPEFLILDEPTVGLDAWRKKLLAKHLYKVAEMGRGMVIVSHDSDFVQEMAGRIISLEKGRVKEDQARKGENGHVS